MTAKKLEFYKCYSINLHRWLRVNEHEHVKKTKDKTTGRTFWIYIMTDELSQSLTEYTEMKEEALRDKKEND